MYTLKYVNTPPNIHARMTNTTKENVLILVQVHWEAYCKFSELNSKYIIFPLLSLRKVRLRNGCRKNFLLKLLFMMS